MAISFLLNCFLQNFTYKHELSFNNIQGKKNNNKEQLVAVNCMFSQRKDKSLARTDMV